MPHDFFLHEMSVYKKPHQKTVKLKDLIIGQIFLNNKKILIKNVKREKAKTKQERLN